MKLSKIYIESLNKSEHKNVVFHSQVNVKARGLVTNNGSQYEGTDCQLNSITNFAKDVNSNCKISKMPAWKRDK